METLNDHHKRLAALGMICSNFSTLEFILKCLVARFVSDDATIGAIVTAEMSFQNLINAFCSLTQYKVHHPKRIKRLGILVKKINAAEQERNAIIHSVYGTEDQSGAVRIKVTAKQRKGLDFHTERIDLHQWDQLTANQVDLIHQLYRLYKDLFGEDLHY